MTKAPTTRIYLFTHKRWEIVRNDPSAPTHKYWAISPKDNRSHGPFMFWSEARAFVEELTR